MSMADDIVFSADDLARRARARLSPSSRRRRYHETQERMMRAACAALGKDRHKMTVIVDLHGYNMRLASPSTLAVLHKRTRLEEDHYPE